MGLFSDSFPLGQSDRLPDGKEFLTQEAWANLFKGIYYRRVIKNSEELEVSELNKFWHTSIKVNTI